MVTIEAEGRGWRFPLYSTRIGDCEEPEAVVDGIRYCRRARNNVLFLGPPELPGWRPVKAATRWNDLDGWRPHDASYQRAGEHRFWGPRHHIRIWYAPDRSYAIGQAHYERWEGLLPRRHKVLSLDQGMEAVAAVAPGYIQQVEGHPVLVIRNLQVP